MRSAEKMRRSSAWRVTQRIAGRVIRADKGGVHGRAVGEADLGQPVQQPHKPRRAELGHDATQVVAERRLPQGGRQMTQLSRRDLIEE